MRTGGAWLALLWACCLAGCGREHGVLAPRAMPGPAPPEPIPRKVLVLLARQQGAATPDMDRGQLAAAVFAAVQRYYTEVSYGALYLVPEFFGWYDVQPPAGTCNLWRVLNAAVEAADGDVDFGQGYAHLVVITTGWGCAASGSTPRPAARRYRTAEGEVTLSSSAIDAGHVTPLVVVHELGHQLGLTSDAGFLACGWQPLRYPLTQCFLQRYGDFYTAMGGGAYNALPPHHFNAPEKQALGFLAAADVQDVRRSGRYRIGPIETRGGLPGALRLEVANDAWLYVEYRQPSGCDTGMDRVHLPDGVVVTDVYEGALLHLWSGGAAYLFDAGAAAGPGDWSRCVLRAGETFVEPSTGNSITVVDCAPGVLTVDAVVVPQARPAGDALCAGGQTTCRISRSPP